RSVETGYESGRDRVDAAPHDDGDRARRLSSGADAGGADGDDDVDVQPDQVFGQARQAVEPTMSPALVERDSLSLQVSQFPHRPTKVDVGNARLRRLEPADARNLPHLSLRSERRRNQAKSENDREPDQPHEHLGGGWLVYITQRAI